MNIKDFYNEMVIVSYVGVREHESLWYLSDLSDDKHLFLIDAQGDPIKTRSGETMFYDGFIFDAFRSIICLCHPAKKDGTASKAIRHMIWSDF